MGAVVSSKFGKNVPDVALYGFFGERELCSDYFVRIAPRNQPQHINFSWCQCVVSRVLDDFGRDLRGDAFLAGMDCANCLQQFLS